MLHILCATLIGLLYGDSGSNASKSFENVGFLLIGIVYLWYTTVMPGVLKCKLKLHISSVAHGLHYYLFRIFNFSFSNFKIFSFFFVGAYFMKIFQFPPNWKSYGKKHSTIGIRLEHIFLPIH